MNWDTKTCLNVLKSKQGQASFLSLGCPILDKTVGGIPVHGITEISGEAGCGKTQVCLTLALQVQLDLTHGGAGGSAAYLCCGEGSFPIRRLSQLAMSYEQRTGISNQQFLGNVHIEQCYNIEDTMTTLQTKIPELCNTQGVRLLIIDSLAGLVRFEYDNRNMQEMKSRTGTLFRLASTLKSLSDLYNIAVVVVNQVKADFEVDGLNKNSFSNNNNSNSSSPTLGMAWASCVNTHISLHRDSTAVRAIASSSSDGKNCDERVDQSNEDNDEGECGVDKNNKHVGNIYKIKQEGRKENSMAAIVLKQEHISYNQPQYEFQSDYHRDQYNTSKKPKLEHGLSTDEFYVDISSNSSGDSEKTEDNNMVHNNQVFYQHNKQQQLEQKVDKQHKNKENVSTNILVAATVATTPIVIGDDASVNKLELPIKMPFYQHVVYYSHGPVDEKISIVNEVKNINSSCGTTGSGSDHVICNDGLIVPNAVPTCLSSIASSSSTNFGTSNDMVQKSLRVMKLDLSPVCAVGHCCSFQIRPFGVFGVTP